MPLLREFKSISSKFPRNLASAGSRLLLSALLSASFSFSATIFDSGLATVKATDPIQTGRLSRSGVPSDWSVPKAFPGVLNTAISYHYTTFVLPSIMYPYIQITIDDVSGTAQTLASAYLNAYTPNAIAPNFGLNINYLGDAGTSGNYFGTDPVAFQVVMPIGGTLVLVVNDASGSGIGQPFRLLVEGFVNTSFNDAPEPATYGLFAVALCLGLAVVKKRRTV